MEESRSRVRSRAIQQQANWLPCSFEGLDEHEAERALGGFLYCLRDLADYLADNISFGELFRTKRDELEKAFGGLDELARVKREFRYFLPVDDAGGSGYAIGSRTRYGRGNCFRLMKRGSSAVKLARKSSQSKSTGDLLNSEIASSDRKTSRTHMRPESIQTTPAEKGQQARQPPSRA